MLIRKARYSPHDAANRGEALFESTIRPRMTADDNGKYVAIDIETGAWEMADDENDADDRLRVRVPDSQTYVTRVGYGYVRRFGAGRVARTR